MRRLFRRGSWRKANRYQTWFRPLWWERALILLRGHKCEDCWRPATGCYTLPGEFGTCQGNFCDRHLRSRMVLLVREEWAKFDGLRESQYGTTQIYPPPRSLLADLGVALVLGLVLLALGVWLG